MVVMWLNDFDQYLSSYSPNSSILPTCCNSRLITMDLSDAVYRFDPEGEDAAQYGDSDVADQIDWDNSASLFETFHLHKSS